MSNNILFHKQMTQWNATIGTKFKYYIRGKDLNIVIAKAWFKVGSEANYLKHSPFSKVSLLCEYVKQKLYWQVLGNLNII